ncbi:hypothetical protein FSP39_004576 [Pinctada imbricata]|uniref:poly(ADP-ribose) glycohydrolase n=1 Tax=Pinctada imbricata TaxID=66713 RepID=A0AA88XVE3_PINIB|nr:hypothetical protein FSP39_004576 [Pinctada imbricata]
MIIGALGSLMSSYADSEEEEEEVEVVRKEEEGVRGGGGTGPQEEKKEGGGTEPHNGDTEEVNNNANKPTTGLQGLTTLHGLVKFFKKYASNEEKRKFLQSTLPGIIDLVLELQNVLPPEGLAIARQQIDADIELSRRLVACILACAFLCLFEERGKPWKQRHSTLNVINFTNFFKQLPSPAQNAKLRCFLDYFDEVTERHYNLHGNIRYVRQVVPREELPTLDSWLNCKAELCPLIVHHEGFIEDSVPEAVEVDFANRFIGGGVLGMGKVQEEIRFTVCPELVSAMLFMERMEENEAIIIQGYEQFSDTIGYSNSLQYAGKHHGELTYDNNGNLTTTLCAIDAVSYKFNGAKQYRDEFCIRDINKAFVGFSFNPTTHGNYDLIGHRKIGDFNQSGHVLHSVDQSYYGRMISHSEEEYFTASENEEEREDQYVSTAICNLADGLIVDIMSSALLEASSIIHKRSQKKSQKIRANLSIDEDNRTSSSSGSKTDSVEFMDHLDVDLRDWVTRFRRRSSNLSDVGSRRSSCSTRYSSDFSSEFEEYYENFQKREQQVRHNTITEEVCHPVIADYAINLVAKLLAEGTAAAANKVKNVEKFGSSIPQGATTKPKPRKLSDDAEKDPCEDTSKAPLTIDRVTAEKFADSLLSKLFVFPNGGPNSLSSNSQLSRPLSPNINIPLSRTKSPSSASMSSKSSEGATPHRNSIQGPTVIDRDLHYAASNIVQTAISSAITKYREIDTEQNITESEEDQVIMASSYSSRLSTDSEISQASSAPGSSFFMNRTNLDLTEHTDSICDKKESVIDISVSPSKGEKKNVQFHKDIVLKDEGSSALSTEGEKTSVHSRSVSESSVSLDSPCQPLAIPKLIVSEDVTNRNGMEEMYNRVAEKLILTGLSSALKDVQDSVGKSYEGASLKFSASDTQAEHSVYVQGGNLVYPGEILRGESYEDVNKPRRFSCFASSLSRDLLTNAFIEVQRNMNGGNYARRSSEPLKISNQAAKQLMEENNGSHSNKEKTKSRTEDDIEMFAAEYDASSFDQFRSISNHNSCGFRDPTLSRFAEELMKTECKIPEFQLLDSTNVSMSGSSLSSFHSSKSGFRDPLLSSFEGELLASSYGRSSTRGSLKRKSQSGSLKRKNRLSENSDVTGRNRSSDESRGVLYDGDTVDRPSYSPLPPTEVSEYAEALAERILTESMNSVFRDIVLPPSTSVPSSHTVHHSQTIADYAEKVAMSIISQTLQSYHMREVRNTSHRTHSEASETEASQRSSGEYVDAISTPYGEIEMFAEKIATSVLQSSIGVIQREQCNNRKRHYSRPISTGNWGCGAFRGDPHLKAMLQWMAASYAGVPFVLYYTFQHEKLIELQEVVDCVLGRGWRLGQLMQAVRTYCMACQDLPPEDQPNLFNLLLDKASFSDIT